MTLKIQYNKTYQQLLTKALRVRENALPTLQAKESALRLEVKKAKQDVAAIEKDIEKNYESLRATHPLWCEFPKDLVSIKDVRIKIRKIAGVKTPLLEQVVFSVKPYSLFAAPSWLPEGIRLLEQQTELAVKREVALRRMEVLEYARKKTTQKVNLYEKVQIPEYRDAILRIKRFLEDDENLAKSSQKILKERLAAVELEVAA
jgi:V/A-type H+-transporting ATPase subunit D